MAALLSDRFDSHSISQESSSEHHNLGLEDLSDDQIQVQIDEINRVNQMLTLENQIFEKSIKKLEPFMAAAIAGTSSSSLSTTPSGSMYDLNNAPGAPPVAGTNASNRYRKRSKSRSTQGDYRMRLTAEQKCEIASKEIEELKDETNKATEDSVKSLDTYTAILQEADIRIQDITKEMRDFERDVIKGGLNPLTKKIIAEKLFKFFEDSLKIKDVYIGKTKLKNKSTKREIQKAFTELKEKEELGEVLHEVDFRQLKIENKQYIEKIDEKNAEMIELKKMVGTITQALNYRKNQLNQYSKEYETIINEIKTRVSILGKLQNETEIVEKEHEKEESKNRKLRAQLENYKVPDVNDYVNAEDYLYNLRKELKVWERKVEIAEMALKINKQTWLQLKANSGEQMNISAAKSSNNYNQISGSAF